MLKQCSFQPGKADVQTLTFNHQKWMTSFNRKKLNTTTTFPQKRRDRCNTFPKEARWMGSLTHLHITALPWHHLVLHQVDRSVSAQSQSSCSVEFPSTLWSLFPSLMHSLKDGTSTSYLLFSILLLLIFYLQFFFISPVSFLYIHICMYKLQINLQCLDGKLMKKEGKRSDRQLSDILPEVVGLPHIQNTRQY